MITLASLRSDRWTACPELVDDFIGIRNMLRDPWQGIGDSDISGGREKRFDLTLEKVLPFNRWMRYPSD